MGFEIIDAICAYYKDDEDTMVDCLVYLKDEIDNSHIRCLIEEILVNMDRCFGCGAKLEFVRLEEWHSEVNASETFLESYCPNCGN